MGMTTRRRLLLLALSGRVNASKEVISQLPLGLPVAEEIPDVHGDETPNASLLTCARDLIEP